MITIYCLFDPRTGVPFYVGATKNVKLRLTQHIAYTKKNRAKAEKWAKGGMAIIKYFPHIRKTLTILSILDAGHKPGISILHVGLTQKNAAYYEKFYFTALTSQGFDIQQEDNRFYKSTALLPTWSSRQSVRKRTYLLEYPQNKLGN
jgi:GIY-YIG catalytic domain